MKIKVSVVLPVYEPGPGIIRCIETLRNQTLKEIEMIFIDDCGKDDSLKYIEAAADDDPRIKILKNTCNEGAGASGNRGIEAASGEYLAFVDPDDHVSCDFFEILYKKAEETGADIVKGICREADENGNPVESADLYGFNNRIREGLKRGHPLFALFTYQHTTAIYRREMVILSNARYAPSNISEDSLFLLEACHAAKRTEFADGAEYYYAARAGSGVRDFSVKRWSGTMVSLREMLGFIGDKQIYTPDGYQYAATRIISILDLQKYYDDNDASADPGAMLGSARELVRSLSFCAELAKASTLVDALVSHGVNLSAEPYGKSWRTVPYSEYENRVDTWVGFLREHPEYGRNSRGYVWKVFENCITYGNWTARGERKEKAEELRKKARQLPDRRVLTGGYISMRLFIDFGLDVFRLRPTWFGKAVRSAAAVMRRRAG